MIKFQLLNYDDEPLVIAVISADEISSIIHRTKRILVTTKSGKLYKCSALGQLHVSPLCEESITDVV